MSYVLSEMPTPFGDVEVIINNGTRMQVRANGPLNLTEAEGRRTIMVNRVEYVVVAHFVKGSEGWTTGHGSGSDGRYFNCHKAGGSSSDFSWPAHDKLQAGLTAAVNAWFETAVGKALLAEAVLADRAEQIKQAASAVLAAEDALVKARAAHAALTAPESLTPILVAARETAEAVRA